MFCKCRECGKHWAVSWMQTIPEDGYVCPKCTKKALLANGAKSKANNADKQLRKYLIASGSIIRHDVNDHKKLEVERDKMDRMIFEHRPMAEILGQSQVVDELINDYYRGRGVL